MTDELRHYGVYYQEYLYFLREYAKYGREGCGRIAPFQYSFQADCLRRLEIQHPPPNRGAEEGEIAYLLRLMRWVFERLLYPESYERSVESMHAAEILHYARHDRRSVNCLGHAIVLTEALNLKGFCAKTIRCLPIGTFPLDNHCMTVVFSPAAHRWIALDPSFNLYFEGEKGDLLSIEDIRRALIQDQPIHIRSNARFISERTDTFHESYLKYIAKNLFRFQANQDVLGVHCRSVRRVLYELIPEGYVPFRVNTALTVSDDTEIQYTSDPTFFWETWRCGEKGVEINAL